MDEDRRRYFREYARRRRAEDPNYGKAAKARWLAKPENREKARAYSRKYIRTHRTPEQMRDAAFKRYHGVTRAEADTMIEEQGGLCAICKQPPRGKGNCSRLHVDHNHETGEIRKMLCTNCNRTLGLVGEDIETLQRMIEYLKSF